jgi:hypothetical protein
VGPRAQLHDTTGTFRDNSLTIHDAGMEWGACRRPRVHFAARCPLADAGVAPDRAVQARFVVRQGSSRMEQDSRINVEPPTWEGPPAGSERYHVGDLLIDVARERVMRGERELPLEFR